MPQETLKPALKQLKGRPGLVGAEIGVYEGINAEYFLRELDIKCAFLIDPYMAYENYAPKTLGLKTNLERAEKVAHAALGRYGHKIRWIKKKSAEAVEDFADGSLDFVYIDGNHSYDSVREDIVLYYPKLKEGGLLAGHDYDYPEVRKAVDEWMPHWNLELHVENTGELRGEKKKCDWWAWKVK